MDPILIVSAGLAGAMAVTVVFEIRGRIRRRRREQQFAKMLELANDALESSLPRPRVITSGMIPMDSEQGRAIAKILGLDQECPCPNCEEERRIQHAEQQKRDGQ